MFARTTLLTLAAAGLTASAHAQCGSNDHAAAQTMNAAYSPNSGQSDIVDTAVSAGSFKTLAAALKAAGLIPALKGDGPFTVFAPTDEAFAKLPAGTVETLLKPENKALLTAVLTYHVVPGRVMAADVVKIKSAETLNGQRIDIATSSGVRVDGANVVKTDIECSNGVIHVIDRVIMPSTDNIIQTATKAGSFETLAAALKAAGLVAALSGEGPFTVFAPTDAAFEALPAGTVENLLKPANRETLAAILKLHVVPGRVYSDQVLGIGSAKSLEGSALRFKATRDAVQVNGSNIVNADIEATNGVIHVIDKVILPG